MANLHVVSRGGRISGELGNSDVSMTYWPFSVVGSRETAFNMHRKAHYFHFSLKNAFFAVSPKMLKSKT
jgi:hypothetical protein